MLPVVDRNVSYHALFFWMAKGSAKNPAPLTRTALSPWRPNLAPCQALVLALLDALEIVPRAHRCSAAFLPPFAPGFLQPSPCSSPPYSTRWLLPASRTGAVACSAAPLQNHLTALSSTRGLQIMRNVQGMQKSLRPHVIICKALAQIASGSILRYGLVQTHRIVISS